MDMTWLAIVAVPLLLIVIGLIGVVAVSLFGRKHDR